MLKIYFIVLALLSFTGCATQKYIEIAQYYQLQTNKPYDEVLAELEIAITEQNFRITGHSRIGKVIRKREGIDFPDFDALQFCNLSHAKTLLELSPDSVRHMPCNITLHTKNGLVIIKTRLLPTDTPNQRVNDFSAELNDKLKQIVDFAAEE